jgi:integrase
MPTIRLTDISIRNLRPPETGQVIYTDSTFPGFGVRLTKGSKSYVLTFGKARKRVTLGEVGKLALREARNKARDILDEPSDALTFKAAVDQFLATHVRPNNKASTAAETERLLSRHFATLFERDIMSLKTGDYLAVTNALMVKTPSEANHAFTALKTMLRWARGQGYIERHPLEDATRPYKPISRDRWLTAHEISTLLSTRPTNPYSRILMALLYTGQRLGQIQAFQTSWIAGDTVRWPAAIMKSGKDHVTPITETTERILRSLTPYRNWGNGHNAFLKVSGLAHFTRHDLRRTYSTHMAQLGVAPHVIEKLLDHQTGTLSTIARTYNRYSFMGEMREAVEKWERHLAKLTATL